MVFYTTSCVGALPAVMVLVVVIVVATPTDQLLITRDPYSRVDLAFVANVEGAMDRGGVA